MNYHPLLKSLQGKLIVSCQAEYGHPWSTPETLAALACAAEAGGAAAIRANGPENIAAISGMVKVPLIAIYKIVTPNSDVYITPDFESALAVYNAGQPSPSIIAVDCTPRPRSGGADWRTLISRIKNELGTLVMADISTLDEGIAACDAGADIVATTLSGYTDYTSNLLNSGPDIALVRDLARAVECPVICEGRIQTPEQAALAIEAGAWSVVVGTAITAIDRITSRFVDKITSMN